MDKGRSSREVKVMTERNEKSNAFLGVHGEGGWSTKGYRTKWKRST